VLLIPGSVRVLVARDPIDMRNYAQQEVMQSCAFSGRRY
jgi:hypothetical protein